MIENRTAVGTDPARRLALDCLEAGIAAVRPAAVIDRTVAADGDGLALAGRAVDLAGIDRILVVGAGKPLAGAAPVLEDRLAAIDVAVGGLVVATEPTDTSHVRVEVGGHPLPTAAAERAATEVRELVDAADEDTLVLAVFGGGGSALLPAPAGDLALADLRALTDALLESGAAIRDVNAVRKHCSAVKGGRLAASAAPARVETLVVSDVVGDDPATVASGPTVPDPTTYGDARRALERSGASVPDSVREHLAAGAAGRQPETPGPGHPTVDRCRTHVIASGRTALEAAAEAAGTVAEDVHVLTTRLRGEARLAAQRHAAVVEGAAATTDPGGRPLVLLSGGETTVGVTGDGTGGPNLEFALAHALACDAGEWVLASVDTDGRDGGTDAAGGIVGPDTVRDPAVAREALAANDSLGYLDERGAVVRTGPTGTNVNDLRALVLR